MWLGVGIGFPALIHDVPHPFKWQLLAELESLNDLLCGEFRLPPPQLADPDSGGRAAIQTPPDPSVNGAAPRSVSLAFLQKCIGAAIVEWVRRAHPRDDLRCGDIGLLLPESSYPRSREPFRHTGERMLNRKTPRHSLQVMSPPSPTQRRFNVA